MVSIFSMVDNIQRRRVNIQEGGMSRDRKNSIPPIEDPSLNEDQDESGAFKERQDIGLGAKIQGDEVMGPIRGEEVEQFLG